MGGARDLKVFVGSEVDLSGVSVKDKVTLGFEMTPDKDQRPQLRVVSVSPLGQ